jgi:hypothetical protein
LCVWQPSLPTHPPLCYHKYIFSVHDISFHFCAKDFSYASFLFTICVILYLQSTVFHLCARPFFNLNVYILLFHFVYISFWILYMLYQFMTFLFIFYS